MKSYYCKILHFRQYTDLSKMKKAQYLNFLFIYTIIYVISGGFVPLESVGIHNIQMILCLNYE